MELTINDEVYKFKFGIGFLKNINKRQMSKTPQGIEQPIGFVTAAAGLMDGNILDLCDVLLLANETEEPRIRREALEDYLDDESTDIDKIFEETIDFLSTSNACKMYMKNLMKFVEKNVSEDDTIQFPAKV